MVSIRPFSAHRPPVSLVARVSCPPYDVIDAAEARALAGGDPDSFLRVTRPEIDLPEGADEHSERVYERGAQNLGELILRGVLRQDPEPTLYVYALKRGEHRQIGVVGCPSVADYDLDLIKKHENTRADKEDDRTRHIQTLGAHDEPAFLTYRAVPEIDRVVAEITRSLPIYDFTTPDDVTHTLWLAPTALRDTLLGHFSAVSALYVADGHHRSKAASRVHALRAGQPGEHDVFMAVLFPHDQLQVLPYNRVVKDPRGRSPRELLTALRERFDLSGAERPEPDEPGAFGLFLGDRWWRLQVRPGTYDTLDPVRSLDVSICQEQILEPVFGISDPRRDTHLDFVGGSRGATELERRVREQGASVALYLYPTRIEQLMRVSDSGLLMPPKSTWFEPKPRSGLFLHVF